MAVIAISSFGGMIPAISSHLLPPGNAEWAYNTWLYDGRLRGMREPRLVHTLVDTNTRCVYRIPRAGPLAANISGSYWLEFTGLTTSVMKSPVRDQTDPTYYVFGDNGAMPEPKYTSEALVADGANYLRLGVPAPASPLTVGAPVGGASTLTEARSYVHTYVTTFGEEGPPSDPTAIVTNKVDATYPLTIPTAAVGRSGDTAKVVTAITQAVQAQVTVAAHGYTVGNHVYFNAVVGMTQINNLNAVVMAVVDANNFKVNIDSTGFTAYASAGTAQRVDRRINKIRIYRTVTSSQGVATFFFVTELASNATSFNDTVTTQVIALNEQLQSADWEPPPTDLEGAVVMPNGMLVAWRERELWFCEPYRPHAWPVAYQDNVDFNIVGIGVVGQTAVVCTEGAPYADTGNHPASMALARVSALSYPCLSKNSIVPTPAGVYYGAAAGLIGVSGGGATVATKGLLSQDDWQRLVTISRLSAALLNGAYYCFSGVGEGVFETTAFEATAFEQQDFTGTRNGALIDFDDKRVAFSIMTSADPTYNVMQDPWSNEVLIIRGSAVYQIDMTSVSQEADMRWGCKLEMLDYVTNIGVGKVYYNKPPGQSDATGHIKVWGYLPDIDTFDLVLDRDIPDSGEQFRLPSGKKFNYYQFEISGNLQVQKVLLASTVGELRGQ